MLKQEKDEAIPHSRECVYWKNAEIENIESISLTVSAHQKMIAIYYLILK